MGYSIADSSHSVGVLIGLGSFSREAANRLISVTTKKSFLFNVKVA